MEQLECPEDLLVLIRIITPRDTSGGFFWSWRPEPKMIFLINKNISDERKYFILFQSEPALLPSCFRLQPHQSPVPRSQQQQARLLAGGDRRDDQPDGAGRFMQWNCPSSSTNWRLVQLEVTTSSQEPSSGGKSVIEIRFCYLIGISLVSLL